MNHFHFTTTRPNILKKLTKSTWILLYRANTNKWYIITTVLLALRASDFSLMFPVSFYYSVFLLLLYPFFSLCTHYLCPHSLQRLYLLCSILLSSPSTIRFCSSLFSSNALVCAPRNYIQTALLHSVHNNSSIFLSRRIYVFWALCMKKRKDFMWLVFCKIFTLATRDCLIYNHNIRKIVHVLLFYQIKTLFLEMCNDSGSIN